MLSQKGQEQEQGDEVDVTEMVAVGAGTNQRLIKIGLGSQLPGSNPAPHSWVTLLTFLYLSEHCHQLHGSKKYLVHWGY